MTRAERRQCEEYISKVRAILTQNHKGETIGQLMQSPEATAYTLTVKLEVELDKLTLPWED